jgi:LmbE family N-acetylglucosaminyl deacetylase
MLILIILIAIIFVISVYLYSLFRLQDFHTKKADISYFRNPKKVLGKTNILFIHPHPDDETMGSGGLIKKLSRNPGFNVHVVSLTKGEKGKELVNVSDEELAQIRTNEFIKAVSILGVQKFELWNYPDGGISEEKNNVKEKLMEYIKANSIDTIVTYERTGIYGHKDHVTLSKIVYEISRENRFLRVLYSTIAPRVEKLYNFPKHIVGLELTKSTLCERPEIRINKLPNIYSQYRAAKSHKSQKLNHIMPLWLALLLQPYEYYTTVYEGTTKY